MSSQAAAPGRDARQLALAGWTRAAQDRVAVATAIVVGAGALGSPAAGYLAAAGIGRIGIVDVATVEPPDTGRGLLHFAPDVGASRAESLAAKLPLLDPSAHAEPYPVRIDALNAAAIAAGADVVLDCSNDVATAAIVAAACCAERIPVVWAQVTDWRARILSTIPGRSACLRCAGAAPTPTDVADPTGATDGDGVSAGANRPVDAGAAVAGAGPANVGLAAIAGVVGALQALEALKLVGGVGEPLLDRVLELDAWTLACSSEPVIRRSDCPVCGPRAAATI